MPTGRLIRNSDRQSVPKRSALIEQSGDDRPGTVESPITGPNAANALPICAGGKMSRISPKACGIITAADEPLHDARGDQRLGRPRERAHRRCRHEADQPDHQHPLAAEHVAEPSAGQQADRDGQGVRRGDPLQGDVDIDRSRWIDGAATLTIVESRMFRIIAERITAKPIHMAAAAREALRAARSDRDSTGGRGRSSCVLLHRLACSRRTVGAHQERFVPDCQVFSNRMSETSGRLLKLLSLLQTPREWPGPELARRLGVTTRTVRNDVERLRQLGYPVRATRGAIGGYKLSAGTAMPPLLLDDDEAVAVAVSLRTASGGAVEGLEETALRALTKLQQVLPHRLGRRVDALQSHTVRVVGQSPRAAGRRTPARPDRGDRARPRDRALRLRRPLGVGNRATRRALPTRQLGTPLVPRGLRPRARRLAHVPGRPDQRDALGRPPLHPASAAGRRHRRLRRRRRPARCR